jgi:hypothetical protein
LIRDSPHKLCVIFIFFKTSFFLKIKRKEVGPLTPEKTMELICALARIDMVGMAIKSFF